MFIAPAGDLFPALRRSAMEKRSAPTELRYKVGQRYTHFASTRRGTGPARSCRLD